MAKYDYEIEEYEVSWKRGRESFLRSFKSEEVAFGFADDLIVEGCKNVEVRKILRAVGWY